ncbi:cysteine desulfurase family protein [Liquorilactobacillus satsumensis]|uniref:cysteine desulfurase family protein n=1 Tax=Liquorilactobacillus satsumensis TaxID=259059 RepID=UPI0039EB1E36
MIYFDNAATTKMSKAALEAYYEVAENFYGNSESLHLFGTQSSTLITQAQQQIATLFKLPAAGFIFTSGGTESNQLGIESLSSVNSQKREILVSPLEHSSVFQILDKLVTEKGFKVKTLPVNKRGKITPAGLRGRLSAQTALVVIQAVNSVTGICQDIPALKKITGAQQVPLFVDAVQAVTKIPMSFAGLAGFSCSAHKFNGPKSSGLLFLNPNMPVNTRFNNVFQQNGFLPGTLDVPGIVSMATALQAEFSKVQQSYAVVTTLKKRLKGLVSPQIRVIAGDYPGICGLILPQTQAQEAVTRMGQLGFCFSTVSACSIRDPRPDRTLQALGLTAAESKRYLRISLGPHNTLSEVECFATCLNQLYG